MFVVYGLIKRKNGKVLRINPETSKKTIKRFLPIINYSILIITILLPFKDFCSIIKYVQSHTSDFILLT